METLIIELVQSGAYSAVFAVVIVLLVRYNLRREEYYTKLINQLVVSLGELNNISVKLDKVLDSGGSKRSRHKKCEQAVATEVGI